MTETVKVGRELDAMVCEALGATGRMTVYVSRVSPIGRYRGKGGERRPPAHFNPTPRFGLVTEEVAFERAAEAQWRQDLEDGWCLSCGDTFRYDDCGGYNPPCECGYHCRHCHENEVNRDFDDEDDYEDYDA